MIYAQGRSYPSELAPSGNILPTDTNRTSIKKILNHEIFSVDGKRWELETRVIGNVFKNITFYSQQFLHSYSAQFSDLAKPDLFEFMPWIMIVSSGKLDHHMFHLHHQSLKFVSCGDAQSTGLNFSALFSVFDKFTWIFGFVAVLLLSGVGHL